MKRKKLLTLLATSSLLISGAAVFAATSASGLGTLDTRASEVQGSIVFSRATGDAYKIDDYTFSVSGKTNLGATYYAVSHNNSDAYDTDLVAKFGGSEPSTDLQYVHFSDNKEGTGNFEFQGITGIKVTTKSSAAQTVYAFWSTTGGDWDWNSSNCNSVSASSNPEKVTFSSSRKFLALKGYSSFPREITSIELFYECSTGGDPGEKTVDHLSFSSIKSNYILGDAFEKPTVVAWYTDDTHEEVEASFSEVDMTKTGKQVVTASYGGVDKEFTIEIWPSATAQRVTFKGLFADTYDETETSDFLTSSSVLPEYGEPGNTVTFTPVFKDAYMWAGVYDSAESIEFDYDGTDVTFTMPDDGAEIYIVYTTNTNKKITYVGVDPNYDYVDVSVFLEDTTGLPSQAEPGSSVSVTPNLKEGFEIYYFEINETQYTPEAGTYTFTMPSDNTTVYLYFQEAAVLESMYVKSPKTKYAVGDSFVMPKVIGVYNTGEQELPVTLDNFSGFDSSTEAEGQVITVSYPGIADVTYTVDIIEGYKEVTIDGVFQAAQGSNTMSLEFQAEGKTGQYVYINGLGTRKFIINFTYEVDDDGNVTIDLADDTSKSYVTSYSNGYRIVNANASVDEWVNTTGYINAGQTEFSIRLWRISSGTYSQDETPVKFTKI